MKLVGFSWFSYRNASVKSNCARYPGLTLGYKPSFLPWVANYWGLGDLLYLAAKRPGVGTKKEGKRPGVGTKKEGKRPAVGTKKEGKRPAVGTKKEGKRPVLNPRSSFH